MRKCIGADLTRASVLLGFVGNFLGRCLNPRLVDRIFIRGFASSTLDGDLGDQPVGSGFKGKGAAVHVCNCGNDC